MWDKKELSGFTRQVKAADRFYRFVPLGKNSGETETLRAKWPVDEKGVVINTIGFREGPSLNLSATKSFTQKDVVEYLRYSLGSKHFSMRNLNWGPQIISPGLDMAAVKYYYSTGPYGKPEPSLRISETRPLWIYENKDAWPYFYIADRVEAAGSLRDVKDPQPGTAYVAPKDLFKIYEQKQPKIDLEKFTFGEMVFRYSGEKDNFLVVADAWHPFWKAKVDSTESPVVKTNFIFKGVHLPPGEHLVRIYFDTSAYRPGIRVSIAAWLVVGCILFWTTRPKIVTKQYRKEI